MRTIQIHYLLKSPGGDYASLEEYIKSLGSWAHVRESVWFVRTSRSVSEVRDALKGHLRTNDRVLVLDVTSDSWASSNIPDDVTEWMHKHMGTVRTAA